MVTVPVGVESEANDAKESVAEVTESVELDSKTAEVEEVGSPLAKSVADVLSSTAPEEVSVASGSLVVVANVPSVELAETNAVVELIGKTVESEPLSDREVVVVGELSNESVEDAATLSNVLEASAASVLVDDASATAVELSKLSSDVLSVPAPTAGTEPTIPLLCASLVLEALAGGTLVGPEAAVVVVESSV